MAMTRNLFTKIKPFISCRPFSSVVPNARAELAAVKAWNGKLWLAIISARAKFLEAEIHSAAMEAGHAPDSAELKANTCRAESDTHLEVATALINEGEAREEKVKARFAEFKARMKELKVSCVELEELSNSVDAGKVDFVWDMMKIYECIAKLETQLVRVEAYNPKMEAQIKENEAQYVESTVQFGVIHKQREEFEAKMAEIYKAGASASKMGTSEQVKPILQR